MVLNGACDQGRRLPWITAIFALLYGRGQALNLLSLFASQIDHRSFSGLWYWIMIALMWAGLTRSALGVPYDLVARARRLGGDAQTDIEVLARIHAERYVYYWSRGQLFQVAFLAFVVSGLFVLAIGFNFEFAQAVLFLLVPLSLIAANSLRGAHLILADRGQGEALHKLIFRHRLLVQLIGFTFIFLTAIFGFVHNLTAGFHG